MSAFIVEAQAGWEKSRANIVAAKDGKIQGKIPSRAEIFHQTHKIMTTARDTIVDALDIESFMLCESEPERVFEQRTLRQSQRDCVLQPRVARDELPWVTVGMVFNPNGVVSSGPRRCRNPVGVGCSLPDDSQGSSCLPPSLRCGAARATLGFAPESLWDSALEFPKGISPNQNLFYDHRPRYDC